MDGRAPIRQRIEAAGAVTISFGVLTAALAIVLLIITTKGRLARPQIWEFALTIAVGAIFTLLGWGVIRQSRLCAAVAAALAGLLLARQVAATFWGQGPSAGSLFFLVLPAFVLAGNWIAWREIGRSPESG